MHGQCAERFGFLDDNIHEALGQGGGGVLHDLLDVLQGLCQRGVGHAIVEAQGHLAEGGLSGGEGHLSGDAHFEGAAGLCTVAEDAHHGGEQIDDGRLDLSVGGAPQIAYGRSHARGGADAAHAERCRLADVGLDVDADQVG